jgi:DNA cross-link repair 1A protein
MDAILQCDGQTTGDVAISNSGKRARIHPASPFDDDNDDDDDDDDFVDAIVHHQGPPARKRPPALTKRSRTSAHGGGLSRCIVCGKLADDAHIDGCIDAVCPPSPSLSPSPDHEPETAESASSLPSLPLPPVKLSRSPCPPPAPQPPPNESSSKSIETCIGPELSKYAVALRTSQIHTVADLANVPLPADNFLRFACGIDALGARKKLAACILQLQMEHNLSPCADSPEFGALQTDKLPLQALTTTASKAHTFSWPKPTVVASVASRIRNVWDSFSANGIFTKQIGQPSTAKHAGLPKPSKLGRPAAVTTSVATPSKPPRKHSFAKRVHGTSFVVDSFRAAGSDSCMRYFLSHFHSDHYENLRKSTLPPGALVLCSAVTASLVHSILRVPRDRIQVLPCDGETAVDVADTSQVGSGATVRLFDANHCPGAVLMLFYVWKTKRYVLHTGDCRFDPSIFFKHTILANIVSKHQLDFLHLDTTYADPRYSFPHQNDIIRGVVEAASREDERTRHRCIFFFGTYSIGKEKVFLAVAEALNLHIFADKRKRGILQQLGFGRRVSDRLVSHPGKGRVHVVPMSSLSADGLRAYTKRSGLNRSFVGQGLAVVFRPTGWSFRSQSGPSENSGGGIRRAVRGADQAVSYEVAYSEHSSFAELKAFVTWARPSRLIPTVNVGSASQADILRSLLGHEDKPLRTIAAAPNLPRSVVPSEIAPL